MKLSIREPIGYSVTTVPNNNREGQIVDFLVDQNNWKIKYMVIDIGGMVNQELNYIPAKYIQKVDFQGKAIKTSLNKKEFHDYDESESIMTISEIIRKKLKQNDRKMKFWERRFYPPVTIPSVTHNYSLPAPRVRIPANLITERELPTDYRSIKEMIGYEVKFRNNKSMIVKDFVIDTISWRLKEVVISDTLTFPWQNKYKVKVKEIEEISCVNQRIYLDKNLENKSDLDLFQVDKPINQNTYGVYFDYRGIVQEK